MKVKREVQHDFVVIKIKFLHDGKLSIVMNGYIAECIEDFGEDMDTICSKKVQD